MPKTLILRAIASRLLRDHQFFVNNLILLIIDFWEKVTDEITVKFCSLACVGFAVCI
ncbi:hypothetical protein [Calothrix sp. NIES-2098]|uniref:hypothetical protein n=1 Tax=Calothrix sp. NIES-2098 TaxID=1954171 RepID=UPI000B5E466E|nr:hypothetical protein NIES2098_34210 [Calothrix sp. NIES-2098]